jgi:hypothetical protein
VHAAAEKNDRADGVGFARNFQLYGFFLMTGANRRQVQAFLMELSNS